MTTTTIAPAKDLDLAALKTLSTRPGPCVTAVLPDHHPGAPEALRSTILRGLLKTASERLKSVKAPGLLDLLEQTFSDATVEAGGQGLAIFRSPDFVACYRVSARTERLSIADHFLLAPFVLDALIPAETFVLGLSTKHLRLFQCSGRDCRPIALPYGVPVSLEDAAHFDRGERAIENRSTTGSSTGTLRHVRFGTAADRDTSGKHLRDFFELVHGGLKPFLAGRTLVLMGVREEIAAYQRIADDRAKVWAAEPGNIEFLTPGEIASRTRNAVLAEHFRRAEQVLAKLREMPDRRHVAVEAEDVLRAAAQGRVHQLCVRAETELLVAPETTGEDSVNAALAETLRNGGEVFVLPQDRLPAHQPLAAILRY